MDPTEPESGPALRDRFPHITPFTLFLVLLLCWVLLKIQLVLVLGLLALLFGTILEGPVQRIQARRVPRAAAITVVYAVLIGAVALLLVVIVPVISDQADEFREQAPEQLRSLQSDWRDSSNPLLNGIGKDLLGRGIEFIEEPGSTVSGDSAERALPVIVQIGTGLVSALTLLVITFYYLLEKALIRRVILEQIQPDKRARVNRVWEDVEQTVGGWMRGQLLLCLVIGSIATISYGIIGLRFWPLLGLWAGVTEIIPIVGPWLGGIPAVLIALTMDWQTAAITVGVIFGMQTLENWFLVPRIMRGAVGLTPLSVFVAILAGTQLLGVVGAVLAIPVAATVQVLITDFLDRRRGSQAPPAMSGWRWMLTRGPLRDDDLADSISVDHQREFVSFEDQIESDPHHMDPRDAQPAGPVPSTENTVDASPPVANTPRPWAAAAEGSQADRDSRWGFLGLNKHEPSPARPPQPKPDDPDRE
jgi:predicted PurR-regulated permease PerM